MNQLLFKCLGAAGTANALSQYVNSLCGNQIKNALRSVMPMNLTSLGPYPDFFAFAIVLIVVGMDRKTARLFNPFLNIIFKTNIFFWLKVLLIIGVKESAAMNKLFVILNTAILGFIIIAGATKSNPQNWNLSQNSVCFF